MDSFRSSAGCAWLVFDLRRGSGLADRPLVRRRLRVGLLLSARRRFAVEVSTRRILADLRGISSGGDDFALFAACCRMAELGGVLSYDSTAPAEYVVSRLRVSSSLSCLDLALVRAEVSLVNLDPFRSVLHVLSSPDADVSEMGCESSLGRQIAESSKESLRLLVGRSGSSELLSDVDRHGGAGISRVAASN